MPKKVPKSIRLSSKARKMLTIACAILVFLFALGITLYPLISNWYNSRHQSEIHTQYLEVLRQVDNSEIILAERYANEYNAAISPGTQLSDAFSKEALLWASEDYENLLNLAGDGIMGYIEIPMIQVNLPIYHGTDSKTLDIGVGHLLGSSLPVGGKGTHTVLTGHSGMATQKMFSDLDKLKLGDVFYLQVLDETLKYLVLILMILVFLSGLGILLYPYIQGYLVDRQIERTAEEFLSRVETAPISPYPSESQLDQDTPSDSPEPTGPDTYTDLWRDMVDYNKEIYINGQKGLDCKLAYEGPSFILADYGLESEVFAVISIPALELEMPVFLGANYRHMADGAAILSQTSIPIGGKNTNCIIAGHRGWGGASYFRYVDKLQPGDEVIITNLWEALQYRVAEIQIIQPNEVEQILIKPGQELVTLLTCHPYASGGRQRYLVICERVDENS